MKYPKTKKRMRELIDDLQHKLDFECALNNAMSIANKRLQCINQLLESSNRRKDDNIVYLNGKIDALKDVIKGGK